MVEEIKKDAITERNGAMLFMKFPENEVNSVASVNADKPDLKTVDLALSRSLYSHHQQSFITLQPVKTRLKQEFKPHIHTNQSNNGR